MDAAVPQSKPKTRRFADIADRLLLDEMRLQKPLKRPVSMQIGSGEIRRPLLPFSLQWTRPIWPFALFGDDTNRVRIALFLYVVQSRDSI